MADIKISELTAVSSLNNGDLVEVSQVNALAPSGYTSLKASMADLGKKVNTDIEYTTDLADFEDKTTLGAIKETAKDKNVADEYDDTHTYNIGDITIYGNTLYICNTNNTTGTFDPSNWTATTIDNVIGDLSSLATTDKSSIVGAVNEVDSDLANLPSGIRCGIGNYSGLKGGGHANRVNVPITFSSPMTGTQYAVFIVVSDAYSDYPYVQGYCFGSARTANGFTATLISMSSDTTTEISGSFYWVAVRYK